MERGLRQWDPLSMLIFLILVEGFNMLIKRSVELRFDKGSFLHFQYADDTPIIPEKSGETS